MKMLNTYFAIIVTLSIPYMVLASSKESKSDIPLNYISKGRSLEYAVFGPLSIDADIEILKKLDVSIIDGTADKAVSFDGSKERIVYFRNSDDSCRIYSSSRITNLFLKLGLPLPSLRDGQHYIVSTSEYNHHTKSISLWLTGNILLNTPMYLYAECVAEESITVQDFENKMEGALVFHLDPNRPSVKTVREERESLKN